jgi:hypothetical protein
MMKSRLGLLISFAMLLLVAALAFAQKADYTGTWAGPLVREAGTVGLEITLARDGASWKATMKMRLPGGDVAPTVEDLKIAGNEISFGTVINSTVVKLTGKFDGDKLIGATEAFRGDTKVGGGTFTLTRGGQMPAIQQAQGGGQVADPNFDAKVAHPAYTKNGPRVLFDEAHNNFHTTSGRYKPFGDLITNDGYQITPNTQKFSAATLKGYDILVISNALGAQRMAAPEASDPAFTDQECDAVREWVKDGGALLLIADHSPMGAANQILGQRFGVDMSKMFTVDEENYEKESENPGFIVYTRESGRLADHAVTRGRNDSERVNKIIAFTGQSLKGPADSVAFMKLADTAQDRMPGPDSKPVSAAGRAQGLARKLGKGRVIVLGEAAMLSAQITGPNKMPFGMNVPGIDNRQLALNIVHWLSGLLN